jgi:ComF family protein
MHAPKVDNYLSEIVRLVADCVLPSICAVCGGAAEERGVDLCSACAAELPRLGVACERCAISLPGAADADLLCGECLRHPSPITSGRAAFRYAWPVHHLLRALKYEGALPHARVLGRLLGHCVAQTLGSCAPDCFCPVPLAPRRWAERGYNQAAEIGREVARCVRVPMRLDLVERVRETNEQVGLSKPERRRNVRRAFKVCTPVQGLHIAVLDDVVTTGSTVRELAGALHRAGAHRIDVWSVARALRSPSRP